MIRGSKRYKSEPMATKTSVLRRNQYWRTLAVSVCAVGFIGFLTVWGLELVEVDVGPLCTATVEGAPGGINPAVADPLAHADSLLDTFTTADHQFQFPAGRDRKATISLPLEMPLAKIVMLGWSNQQQCTLRVRMVGDSGRAEAATMLWRAESGVPPICDLTPTQSLRRFEMEFSGSRELVINNVSLFARWPRILAVIYWILLAIVGPWLLGLFWLAGVLGFPRLIAMIVGLPTPAIAHRLVWGIVVAGGLAAVSCLLPTSSVAAGLSITLLIFAGFLEIWNVWLQSGAVETSNDGDVWRVISRLSLLLVAAVAVETYLLRGNRVVPYDFLMPLFGAQRFAAGAAVPSDLAARPWLTHLLFMPVERISGPFGYPIFVGLMAALNATVAIAIFELAKRWRLQAPTQMTATLACMPVVVCLHFVGQRPASAGLLLLALLSWFSASQSRQLFRGGLAATLAIGLHPGALFVLPGIAACILFPACRWFSGQRFRSIAFCVAMPAVAYGIWSIAVHRAYPEFRNSLELYPILPNLDGNLPAGDGLFSAAAKLTSEQWLALAENRRLQLFHYLISPSVRDAVVELFRPICLPNCLGWVGTMLLLVPACWRKDGQIFVCGIVFPLLVHHAYIGQAHAQFHISPLPFILLAAVVAAAVIGRADAGNGMLSMVARGEWLFRIAYPLGLLIAMAGGSWSAATGRLSVFRGDVVCGVVAGLAIPIAWLWLAVANQNEDIA